MANGDGIDIDRVNMMISLTKLVMRNKSDSKRFKDYIKVWLHEANDLPEKFNKILFGLLIIVRGDGSDFIFEGQRRAEKKVWNKVAKVDPADATKLAEYYRTMLKLN